MKTHLKLLVVLPLIPMLMACPKKHQAIAPEPDTELESTVDMTFAMEAITDIDMICGFIGEDDLFAKFYMPAPVAGNGVATPLRHDDHLFMAYSQTECVDGKKRGGTVTMNFHNNLPNADYYREWRFVGRVTLEDYKVNGWLIKTTNGTQATITNLLPASNYNPAVTNLSWEISGSFDFTHPTDPKRNMTWKGTIVKTLVNTSNPAVFNPSRNEKIKWPLAVVEYKGKATGTTGGNVPYTMEITEANPLTRDFTCFPNKIGGVVSIDPTVVTWNNESHPFVKGIVSFTTGELYPRQVYYGNEGSDLAQQCDNAGTVLIKGISYKVNF